MRNHCFYSEPLIFNLMKSFEKHFTENEILRQVCKIRVKMAKSKSKMHLLNSLTSNPKYNYHLNSLKEPTNTFEEYQFELTKFLSTILPPRKKWVKLGEDSRVKSNAINKIKEAKENNILLNKRNYFLSSTDKNFYSLLKSIKIESKKELKEQWYINLQNFIQEIIGISQNQEYIIEKPIIVPKLKEKTVKIGNNECRPICLFNLKDRILLSLTNKFLTRLFDGYFQNSSYAFRFKKNDEKITLSHHDCIRDIIKFRNDNIDKELYVTECDMKKFYDTVNHKIAKALFDKLILKAKTTYPHLKLDNAVAIFESYLHSFAFNFDMPKTVDLDYWNSYKIKNGEFKWIPNNILKIQYNDLTNERIGVPQGGALSGLIANIYLNDVDIALIDKKVLYQRFCDDMIIISESLEECNDAKNLYINALEKLKLFPHEFKNDSELIKISNGKINYKPFWCGKSKGPFKWGKASNNTFPWIGFVGYEINYLGDIRIRKSSLQKELLKQKKIVDEIKNAIETDMRKPKGTATESAINRLIGMSVGRIGIDNFEEASSDLCWKNGFKELSLNEHSSRQIKQLDRNRCKQYYKLLQEIKDPEIDACEQENRQIIKYNKPFSYFYQVLERQKKFDD